MSTRFSHANIVAEDWRSLAKFYEEVFECVCLLPERDVSGEWLGKGTGVKDAEIKGVHLRLPGFQGDGPTLEIFSYSHMKEKPLPKANRLGVGHLAFNVDNVQETLEKVINNGGDVLGEIVSREIPDLGKIIFVYALDPEGNILELQSWS